MKKISLVLFGFMLTFKIYAADVVPYSIQSIKSVGSGYVELVGPGKIQINKETIPYEGTKFIKVTNIGTMSTVTGVTKGCMLAYSSEGYTENISVLKQSCNEILTIVKNAY